MGVGNVRSWKSIERLSQESLECLHAADFLGAARCFSPILEEITAENISSANWENLVEVREDKTWEFLALGWLRSRPIEILNGVYAMSNHFLGSDHGAGHSIVGRWVYHVKPYHNPDMKPNPVAMAAIECLSGIIGAGFVRTLKIDVVVSVPSSSPHSLNFVPRRIAEWISVCSPGTELAASSAISKVRETSPAKYATDPRTLQRDLYASMEAAPESFGGKRVLLVDDVIGSGISLQEAARALRTAGARAVYAFALTKTTDPFFVGDSKW
jgi:hypothetical protein